MATGVWMPVVLLKLALNECQNITLESAVLFLKAES